MTLEDGIAKRGLIASSTVYLAGLIAAGLALHVAIVAVCAIASAGVGFLSYHAWLWGWHGVAGGLSMISNLLAVAAMTLLIAALLMGVA